MSPGSCQYLALSKLNPCSLSIRARNYLISQIITSMLHHVEFDQSFVTSAQRILKSKILAGVVVNVSIDYERAIFYNLVQYKTNQRQFITMEVDNINFLKGSAQIVIRFVKGYCC